MNRALTDGPYFHYCIQCADRTSGKVGDFVFNPENKFVAISPVFNDLIELFQWMNENKYHICPHDKDGNNYYPFRCEKLID